MSLRKLVPGLTRNRSRSGTRGFRQGREVPARWLAGKRAFSILSHFLCMLILCSGAHSKPRTVVVIGTRASQLEAAGTTRSTASGSLVFEWWCSQVLPLNSDALNSETLDSEKFFGKAANHECRTEADFHRHD